jgi:hypothetical protein
MLPEEDLLTPLYGRMEGSGTTAGIFNNEFSARFVATLKN